MIELNEFWEAHRKANFIQLQNIDWKRRYKRLRRLRNQRKYMGTMKRNFNDYPVKEKKSKKYKKQKKGDAVHQRLVAVGGAGTRYREKKNTDVTPTITWTLSTSTWNAPILLNGVATGDDGVSRDGRKVLFKKILVKALHKVANTSNGTSMFRFVIVYDKQANGAAPAITDVFTEDYFLTTNNLGNVDRFVILKDWITKPMTVDGPEATAETKSKSTQMETLYSGTTNAITSISSGAIWLFCCSAGTETTAAPTTQMRIRLRFIDV